MKYLPLDRITVRPLPEGYKPSIAVRMLHSHAVVPKKWQGMAFSIACGNHDHVFVAPQGAQAAREWVDAITRQWFSCVHHSRRSQRMEPSYVDAQEPARLRSELQELRARLAQRDAQLARDGSDRRDTDAVWQQYLLAQARIRELEALLAAGAPPAASTSASASSGRRYRAVVCTSNVRGAGSTARVSISFHGAGAERPTVWLEAGPHDFERGRRDTFVVGAEELLGDAASSAIDCNSAPELPQALVVSHDGSGAAPAWHLAYVELHALAAEDADDAPSAPMRYYELHDWIGAGKGAASELCVGERAVRLPARRARGPRPDVYELRVHTSDVRGASTDASVWVALVGERSRTRRVELSSDAEVCFVRAGTDVFEVEGRDLGDLSALVIGHDGRGFAPAWHLASVEVRCKTRPEMATLHFPCHDWIRKEGGTAKSSPARDGSRAAHRTLPVGAAAGAEADGGVWRVSVQTSDMRASGTTAAVRLTMYGTDGTAETTAGPFLLESGPADFQRGRADDFGVRVPPSFGFEVTHIRVEHDNAGHSPAWHLRAVEITTAKGRTILFPCGRWLAVGERDSTKISLYPSGSGAELVNRSMEYAVRLVTGSARGAATDGIVSVRMVGALDGERHVLHGHRESFERGRTDTFTVKDQPLGDLTGLEVEVEGASPGADWFVESARVDCAATGQVWHFDAARWLDAAQGKRCVLRTCAVPSGDVAALHVVTIATAAERGAGTRADVSISFVDAGDDGAHTSPERLDAKADAFARGGADVFKVRLPALLNPVAAVLMLSGIEDDFLVDHVRLERPSDGRSWLFPSGDRWTGRDGVRTIRIAAGTLSDAAPAQCGVVVRTADARCAGTDAGISVEFVGAEEGARSGPHALDHFCCTDALVPKDESGRARSGALAVSHSGLFQRGGSDAFAFEVAGGARLLRGGLREVIVCSDGMGVRPNWCMEELELTLGDQVYHCLPPSGEGGHDDHWLGPGTSSGALRRTFAACSGPAPRRTSALYTVRVQAADLRGAGTDSDLQLTLRDEHERVLTAPLPLELRSHPSTSCLRRAELSVFKEMRFSPDIGLPASLLLRTNEMGPSPAFCVRWVEIEHAPSGEKETYGARTPHGWLGTGKAGSESGGSTLELRPRAKDTHTVSFFTGDEKGAGTDAAVHCELHGELNGAKASSGRILIADAEGGGGAFERNRRDDFCLPIPSLRGCPLTSVTFGHDAGGVGAAWYVDRIEVVCLETGAEYVAECACWLGREKRPLETTAKLMSKAEWEARLKDRTALANTQVRVAAVPPSVPIPSAPAPKPAPVPVVVASPTAEAEAAPAQAVGEGEDTLYIVRMFTERAFGAGGGARLSFALQGTADVSVDVTPPQQAGCFAEGGVDEFEVRQADVGDLRAIRVALSGEGFGAGIKLARIEVVRRGGTAGEDTTWRVAGGVWLGGQEGAPVSRELEVQADTEETQAGGAAA